MSVEHEIQQQVRQVDEKVNKVDNKVDKILMVLVGNGLDKDDNGIIGQVNDHEERIIKGERWRANITNKAIGIGIGISLFAGIGIREVIAIIFK